MNDLSVALAELNANGGQSFDPVRYRFIEALLRRAEALPDFVAESLKLKASAALVRYQSDFDTEIKNLRGLVAQSSEQQQAFEQHLLDGNFAAAQNVAQRYRDIQQAQLQPTSKGILELSALTQLLRQHEPEIPAMGSLSPLAEFLQQQERDILASIQEQEGATQLSNNGAFANTRELKSLAPFRQSWQKRRAEHMAKDVAEEAPENPGPLNQHMLVIRALGNMRELSPAFFNRYIAYMGSVMWLGKLKHTPKKNT